MKTVIMNGKYTQTLETDSIALAVLTAKNLRERGMVVTLKYSSSPLKRYWTVTVVR